MLCRRRVVVSCALDRHFERRLKIVIPPSGLCSTRQISGTRFMAVFSVCPPLDGSSVEWRKDSGLVCKLQVGQRHTYVLVQKDRSLDPSARKLLFVSSTCDYFERIQRLLFNVQGSGSTCTPLPLHRLGLALFPAQSAHSASRGRRKAGGWH